MAWAWRTLAAGGSLLLGAVVGVAAVALHGYLWGLALGVLTSALTLRALPRPWWGRLPFALAWVAVAFVASQPRAEGDYLVASNARGYALLLAGLLLLGAALVGLAARRDENADAEDRGAVT